MEIIYLKSAAMILTLYYTIQNLYGLSNTVHHMWLKGLQKQQEVKDGSPNNEMKNMAGHISFDLSQFYSPLRHTAPVAQYLI